MSEIIFNEQQDEGLGLITQWYRDFQDSPKDVEDIFFFAGYAGTGKTTVAKTAATRCVPSNNVAYIAPTGKAASRLRKKGARNAMTLHRFLYNYVGQSHVGDERLVFEPKYLEDRPRLILLDEAPMVGMWDVNNLRAHGIPILAMGDTGQLEPVRDSPFFTEGRVDYMLDIIERNGGNITRAAFFIRTGGRLPAREYDDVKVYDRPYMVTDIKAHLGDDSIILCSYNNTRQLINHKARASMSISHLPIPQVGEKLVCTFNQRDKDIMNGQLVTFKSLRLLEPEELSAEDFDAGLEGSMCEATVYSHDDEKDILVNFNLRAFTDQESDSRKYWSSRNGGFDFGYALTVHKSQGSEWDKVMVVEEFLRSSPYHKLMYTAVTRAIKHLTVFRSSAW